MRLPGWLRRLERTSWLSAAGVWVFGQACHAGQRLYQNSKGCKQTCLDNVPLWRPLSVVSKSGEVFASWVSVEQDDSVSVVPLTDG